MITGERIRHEIERFTGQLTGRTTPDRALVIFWFGSLWLLGLLCWGFFLNWGDFAFDFHDWMQEGARYNLLADAVRSGQIPLFISTQLASTNRFLSLSDVVLSPQIILLRWVEPAFFVLINTFILYTVGTAGVLLIRKRFNWSCLTTGLVMVLFSLNGHLAAHIAVGHSMWSSYFLLPFWMLLLFELLEDKATQSWTAKTAGFTFILFLQGGFHFVAWILMMMAIMMVFAWKHASRLAWTIAAVIGINAWRILPIHVEYSEWERFYTSGYDSIQHLLQSITTVQNPMDGWSGAIPARGIWEVNNYLGLLGFLFVLVFGMYGFWIRANGSRKAILGVMIGMTLLSMGRVYQPLFNLPISVFRAERISTRMVILPIVTGIFLAGIVFDEWVKRRKKKNVEVDLLMMGGMLFVLHDLINNLIIWRVERVRLAFDAYPVNIDAHLVTMTDTPYIQAIQTGFAVTALTVVILVGMRCRPWKKKTASIEGTCK